MTKDRKPEQLAEDDLDAVQGAGTGNLTLKRGTFDPTAKEAVLFFDEADGVRKKPSKV